MALEDQLFDNFRQLPPEERQNLVAFSRLLVQQNRHNQANSSSESKHQRLIQAIAEVAEMSTLDASPEDGSLNDDGYLYGCLVRQLCLSRHQPSFCLDIA